MKRECGLRAGGHDVPDEAGCFADADAKLAREFEERPIGWHLQAHVEHERGGNGRVGGGAGLGQDGLQFLAAVERKVAHAMEPEGFACRAPDADRGHEILAGLREAFADEADFGHGGDVEAANAGRMHHVEHRQGVVRLHRVHGLAREAVEEGPRHPREALRMKRVDRLVRLQRLDHFLDRHVLRDRQRAGCRDRVGTSGHQMFPIRMAAMRSFCISVEPSV